MKLKDFKNYVSKYGYLVADATLVPEGISKKTGKQYDAFAYLVILEYGAEKTTIIYLPVDKVATFLSSTSEFEYLEPVEIAGTIDASGRFIAEKIEPFDFSEA